MFKKHWIKRVLTSIFLICSISLELKADNMVTFWNQEALNLIQKNKVPPTIAARTLAIVHTSIYDAWVPYDAKAAGTRRGRLLKKPVAERTIANKEQAISFAAFRALVDLFPDQEANLVNLMISLGFDPSYTTMETETPAGIGNLIAYDLLNFRHEDGSNQLGDKSSNSGAPYSDYTDYHPRNSSSVLVNPSYWQALLMNKNEQKFLHPQWGLILPFALKTPDQFLPSIQPALYPSEKYLKQAEAILKLSAELDDEKKAIIEYWADLTGSVTPPGHWNLFAQFVSRRDHHTLDNDAKMFFALNNALFDCSIAVWYVKRLYESVRPITAIHFLFNGKTIKAWGGPGQGPKAILGQTWQPYLSPTPPFPEFISGHSTFSSAAAEVLKRFTGSGKFGASAIILRGSSLIEPGSVPAANINLYWKTFKDAANQAGYSRRLGGIHFKDGDLQGRKMGKKIGHLAFEIAQQYIEGAASSHKLNP